MLEVFDNLEQNSPEWIKVRLGLATASMFSAILAKGEGKTRATYMRKLAGERITGEPAENFTNPAMDRGHLLEDDARKLYSFYADIEPTQVGFVKNGKIGASPDSLLNDDGALEIKTKKPELLIETILRDDFPPEHKAQCQGVLLVTERAWIDIAVYYPGMPFFTKRAKRDEAYLKTLHGEIDRFNDELEALVEKIRSYGAAA
jgi:hypothetical protein